MNRRKYPRAVLPAFALCLFAAAAMLVSPAASGQKGGRAAEEIGQVLDSFETVTLDPAEALRSARDGGSVTLQTARGTFELIVEPYDVRTDDYRAVAASGDGVMTELARTPSHSWRGRVAGQEGTVVRLYLDGEQLQGVIITPTETFYVEPARDLSAAAGAKDFVFYSATDVKPTEGECVEATLGGKVAAEAARSGEAASAASNVAAANATSGTPPADEAFGPMPEAVIATEADFEFYSIWNGSNVTTTNNDILNIMTQVDGIYEAQLGVSLRVGFQRVWTTNTDPYTLTDASNALEEFADNYDNSFGTNNPPTRDLTHMFTGKDFDGTTIGIAYRGVVCDIPDASYGISQSRFSAVNELRVSVTAHELGHNFGATHPNQESPVPSGCSPSIMNSSVQQQFNPTFCPFSRDQITSHLTGTGGSCLARLTQPGCTYALTAPSQFFPATGGSNNVGVNAGGGCNWGVAEGSDWITPSVLAGSGSGLVPYTVAPNTTTGPREAAVDIGAQKFIVRQAAAAGCGSTPIAIGQTVNGSLAATDCRSGQTNRVNSFIDLYTFTARAGQRVRIQMNAAIKPTSDPPPAGALDTFLYLLGPDGAIIASNDDIVLGNDTDSRIPVSGFFTLPATGVYTIEATSFDNNDDGAYSLTLTDSSSTNSVSLSSAAYSVNEGTGGGGLGVDGTGFRVVTVTRTGTTSGTATVDYATSDGTASRLKDYEQALGTLVFAPNETSKTFTVFVPDDAFAEAPETVTLTLSNPVGAVLGATQTATLTIVSNDGTDGPSPVRAESFNGSFFVRQQYLDFLNREPDASGFGFWSDQLTNCSNPPPADLTVCRVNVSAAFFQAIEFQETGYLAYRMYKAAYGDATSPNVPGTVPVIRLNEFLPDAQRIGKDLVVGAPGWPELLAANKQAYALEFVLRQRFLTAFPLTMTSAQFVDQLVGRAGITLTPAERSALIAQLDANANVAAARAAVLLAVAENQQLRDNEFRRAFVLMQYYGYLRRDPDTGPNTDFTGWAFWLGKLNEFNGNFVQAEMVKAFLTADEYVDRFGTRP
ncbi:MAG TPA: zinc-dependent metalloprotease family protein [Pyrinomonadaceae bacterium]